MSLRHLLLLLFAATLAFGGCSDDDDDPVDPGVPEDPYVASVAVDPSAYIFEFLGEDTRFAASALDQSGVPIDTVFVWTSTDENVVMVDQAGEALATGLGSAMIIATAGAAADTAEVTVNLGGGPMVEWIAGGSGEWENTANWSTGEVPGPGDTVVIAEDGTYTVSIAGPVQVAYLVLGGGEGVQTLETGLNSLTVDGGGLLSGGLLAIDGPVVIRGEFLLAGGDIEGEGLVTVAGGAELHQTGNPVNLRADLDNRGTIVAHPGTSLRVEADLDNTTAGLFEMRGDAYMVAQDNGVFSNRGTILKESGEEEATIVVSTLSSGDFNSNGSIEVGTGTLRVSGGTIRGRVDIAAEAALVQSGETRIPSLNQQGEGWFVVTGRIEIGSSPGQIVNVSRLVLDSTMSPTMTGPASLLVNESLVWRQGMIALDGSFGTQVNTTTTMETRGNKGLLGTDWNIQGAVSAGAEFELSLRDGAVARVAYNGSWVQSGSGLVSEFSDGEGTFEVVGDFTMMDEGAFSVDAAFVCAGHLDLRAGLLVGNGDFLLEQTGVITGGGTGGSGDSLRLNLLNANAAEFHGTLRPGLGEEYALFEIQGRPAMGETFTIELDVVIPGDFNAEKVTFLSSGVEFGGTLALEARNPSTPNVDYVVITSHVATGEFSVTGDEQFDEVDQGPTGVVLRRF